MMASCFISSAQPNNYPHGMGNNASDIIRYVHFMAITAFNALLKRNSVTMK